MSAMILVPSSLSAEQECDAQYGAAQRVTFLCTRQTGRIIESSNAIDRSFAISGRVSESHWLIGVMADTCPNDVLGPAVLEQDHTN
jgi:hypothetical protein